MQRSKPTSKPSPNLPEIESINSLQNGLGLSHFNTFYRMVHPHHFDLWFSCSISYKVVCPPVKCWLLHVHPMNYRSSINPRYVMFHPLSYHEPVIKRFLGFVKFFPVMLMLIKYHRNPSYAYNLILRFFCLKHPVFWSKSPSLAEKKHVDRGRRTSSCEAGLEARGDATKLSLWQDDGDDANDHNITTIYCYNYQNDNE